METGSEPARASLRDSLDHVLARAPETLVPAAARHRLQHLADALPPIVRGLLECRLTGARTVDLSLGVLDRAQDRDRLHACFRRMADGSPAWDKVMAFMASWTGDRRSDASDRYAWFEFDLDGASDAYPAPSVFLSVGASAAPGWEAELACLSDTAPMLAKHWLARLPQGATVDFLGVMVPRGDPSLRINLSGLDAGTAWRWMAMHGAQLPEHAWPHFETLFAVSAPVLAVEAGRAGLGARVGVECRPASVAAAERVFDLCRGLSLCGPDAMGEAEHWRGMTSALEPGARLPMHMLMEALAHPERGPVALLREVNHIKLTFTPAGVEDAKIYLLFEERFQNGTGAGTHAAAPGT